MKFTRATHLLAAVALAVSFSSSSFAAGSRGSLHAASQAPGFVRTKPWIPSSLQISSAYVLDDGTSEEAVGFGNGEQNFEAIWFNQFNVIPGETTVRAVEIAWGSPVLPQDLVGIPIRVGIWSDPNGDGNPSDAVLLASFAETIHHASTDTFDVYRLSPAVVLPEGATSFFVGDVTPMLDRRRQLFFQALDQTSTHRQSWVSAHSDGSSVDFVYLGTNDFVGIIDDFGLPGNWMIRADTGTDGFFLESAASVKTNFAIDSGTVEDRSAGSNGLYTLVLTFNQEIASVEGASASCGGVRRVSIDSMDPHKVVVTLARLSSNCNATEITVTVGNVMDTAGDLLEKAPVTFGLLIGDVNGDRTVDEDDLAAIEAVKGQTTDETNFRADLNVDGIIDLFDFNAAMRALGTSLP